MVGYIKDNHKGEAWYKVMGGRATPIWQVTSSSVARGKGCAVVF
jgi:hypothetical protein